MTGTLESVSDGNILTITIHRPDSLNALSLEVLEELSGELEALHQRVLDRPHEVRGLILTGAGGRAFIAGADIRAMAAMDAAAGRQIGALGQGITVQLESLPIPVIAAVDGVALGGGCEFAMACDLIYATEASRFGQPEVKLGIMTGFGGAVRLPRYVGLARARELMYSGRIIDAQQAHAYGLVAELFANREALFAGARETLQAIAANSPAGIAASKAVLAETVGMDTATALAHELDAFAARFGTAEMHEGTSAFLEKRAPRFAPDTDAH